MRLKLLSTTIKDFKGYQEKEVPYAKGNVTEIKGRNEQGKTTIADAFYKRRVGGDKLPYKCKKLRVPKEERVYE